MNRNDRVPRRSQAPGRRASVSKDAFRDDPMYSSIMRAVAAILAGGSVVTPINVLVKIGWLAPDDLEAWRFGRVPYLERAIRSNLTRLSRFLRILGSTATT